MTIQRSASVTEALFNANAELDYGTMPAAVLERTDLLALLEHIGNLEFEILRANGTIAIHALHDAFERGAST